ncbi:X-linked interleukin-1 receptor accessory protein-like 2 [Styela clava]
MLIKEFLAIFIIVEFHVTVGTQLGKQITTENRVVNCTNLGIRNVTAHIGWPFYFSCKNQAEFYLSNITSKYYERPPSENVTCIVYDKENILWNTTVAVNKMKRPNSGIYNSFDVTEGPTSMYRIQFSASPANYCSFQDIWLHREKFTENHNCRNMSQAIGTIERRLKVGQVYRMSCQLDYEARPALYIQNISEAEYIWMRNCSEKLPKNARIAGNTLILTQVDFSTGGIYSCKVKYKGNERYVTRHQVCIQHGNTGKYAMKCPEKKKVKLGDDVNITCSVNFGPGEHFSLSPTAIWSKTLKNGTEGDFCTKFTLNDGPQNSSLSERADCDNVQISNLHHRCFMYEPPPDIQEALKHLVRLTLIIKEMKASDAGFYGLIFTVGNKKSTDRTIELVIDQEETLQIYAYKISLGILSLVLLLLLTGICVWKKIDILWFGKKYFGRYEKDVKNYTAYLVYHYSTENMTEKSKKMTKKLVESLYKVFHQLNATVYDDHRDENQVPMQIENISRVQNECHRVIIILNLEYVTDHLSIHKAYVALRNLVEGRIKLIFIVLPGVKKYFKNIPKEPRTALKQAMKMSTTISWCGSTPLKGTTRRHLEYALPKCKKQNKKGESQDMRVLEDKSI